MRPAQNHKRIKIILIRLIVINLFLSGIRLDRGTPVKVDRGTPVRVDRGISFDRGISDADPTGEPCQAIHASKANLSQDLLKALF